MGRGIVSALASALLAAAAAAAYADEVVLETGERLQGTVLSRTEAEVVLDHPILGKLTIPAGKVVEAKTPKGEAVPVAPPPPPPPTEWKYSGEVGVNGTEGNVDNQDLRAAVQALYEGKEHRWRFAAGYSRSETEDVKTKDQGYVEGLKDFLYEGSPWFWFLTARMDWDDFQVWDSRFAGGAGAGYAAYETDEFKLRFRAGLNYIREFNVDEDAFPDYDDDRWEGLLGAESVWKLTKGQVLEGKVTYYPDFDDTGEFRVVGSLAWSVDLNESGSLAFKLGLENEYDSHREDPAEENDLKYFAALLFRF
jgi:putative salt-induced outer membrane protein YdiY